MHDDRQSRFFRDFTRGAKNGEEVADEANVVGRNLLIDMVPPRRLERPTNGLGRRTKRKSQVTEFSEVGLSTMCSVSFELSIHFPLVSRKSNRPDL